MNIKEIDYDIHHEFCSKFTVYDCGTNRFQIQTPFEFGDDDCFVVILRKSIYGGWELSDEGRTLRRLETLGFSVSGGILEAYIARAMTSHGIVCGEGEFRIQVREQRFGHALFAFIQGLAGIFAAAEFWSHLLVKAAK